MNPTYIAFEGIDGSGKSSIAKLFSEKLLSSGTQNIVVREPGGTKVGEGVRNLLLSHEYNVSPLTEALLFSSQRSQLISEVVKPALDDGVSVITDRCAYSSVAYQGVGRGLGYEKIYQLNDIAINSFWPERVVLLDINPDIALARQEVADRIGSDKLEFFTSVREGYLRIAEEFENKFLIINAEEEVEEILKQTCHWLGVE